MNTTSKIVLGVMGAAAVVALVGILVAPEKAAEIRKKIASGAGDVADEFGKILKKGKEELASLTETAKTEARNARNSAEEKFGRAKGSVEEHINRVKESV